MTEPTQDPQDEVVLSFTDALGLDADTPSYTVTKTVNGPQLESEIQAASNADRVEITFTDFDVQDEDHPVTVYVVGAKSKKSVTDAIAAHQADSRWGWTSEQVTRADALDKLRDPDATLDTADITAALRALLPAAPDAGVPAPTA